MFRLIAECNTSGLKTGKVDITRFLGALIEPNAILDFAGASPRQNLRVSRLIRRELDADLVRMTAKRWHYISPGYPTMKSWLPLSRALASLHGTP